MVKLKLKENNGNEIHTGVLYNANMMMIQLLTTSLSLSLHTNILRNPQKNFIH